MFVVGDGLYVLVLLLLYFVLRVILVVWFLLFGYLLCLGICLGLGYELWWWLVVVAC